MQLSTVCHIGSDIQMNTLLSSILIFLIEVLVSYFHFNVRCYYVYRYVEFLTLLSYKDSLLAEFLDKIISFFIIPPRNKNF